ncbi:hypothetical protein ACSU1N_01275 [Thermogladius sp. 4427co]|uniref:hypothetical protein n=1 Tax=Thermogladius sp. 4427co TaxID=3450718 RepID=UPI003F7B2830
MLKFWKSDREKFDEEMSKAFDSRNKGRIDEAIEHFMKAYEIASRSKDETLNREAIKAYAYATIYKALQARRVEYFDEALKTLASIDGDYEFDLALASKVKNRDLIRDFEMLRVLYSLPQVDLSNPRAYSLDVAGRYEEAAKKFLSGGSGRFVIEDLVDIRETFESIGFRLLAVSRIIQASHVEEEDPSRAIEIYSEALGYLSSSAKADAYVKRVSEKINKLGKATRCWICGRPIQGEEVNFIYLDTFTTKYMLKNYGGEDPNMLLEGRVAVCSVCYGAIYKLSDKISTYYYHKTLEEMKKLEERLMAQIMALRAEIESLRASVIAIRAGMRRSGPGI